jgi:putative tricarboxylic transport membrane protein
MMRGEVGEPHFAAPEVMMKPFAWRGNTDFYSGLLLAGIAVFALIYVRTLDIGTVHQMGPGYFPLGLSLILLGMGLVLIVKGVLSGGPAVETVHLRPLFFVLLSFALFGVLIERAGLICAILAQVLVAHFGSRETRLSQSLILGVGLAAVSSVLFVWLLKIPVSLLP